MTEGKCCKRVYGGGRSFTSSPCKIKATVERNGAYYCRIHDPEAVKARDAERDAKWKAEWAAKEKLWARQKLDAILLEALLTAPYWEIEELVTKWRSARG